MVLAGSTRYVLTPAGLTGSAYSVTPVGPGALPTLHMVHGELLSGTPFVPGLVPGRSPHFEVWARQLWTRAATRLVVTVPYSVSYLWALEGVHPRARRRWGALGDLARKA